MKNPNKHPKTGLCVATGASLEEVEAEIREAIAFHLDGMREDGVSIPTPQSKVDYVEVST